MRFTRRDAKAYARANFKGLWAAAQTPFLPDLAIDEAGLRRNLRHWVDDLGVDGVFVGGKQGEFFSMSVPERKRLFDIALDEIGGTRTIMSCSDQNMDVVLDLARHAKAIGSDYIVVHAPVLHFFHKQDETLYEYYRYISEQVEIGIALWSHPDSGYLMSPELCARIAETAERGGDQVQRAAGDVCAAHAARRRQDPGQHGVGRGMVRQHRRARLAALPVLVAALHAADQGRPPHARVHRSRLRRRGGARQGGARQPQSGARSIPQARGRRRNSTRIRNTGRSCSARPAAVSGVRCSN